MAQCVNEQVGALSSVEAKRHFVQIGLQMLCADFVPTGVALLSAHIGFVHFDSTIQHWTVNLSHGCTNAVEQIPRRFVRAFMLAPEGTLELHGTDALAGLNQEQDGHKPRFERKMGIVKDGLRKYAELIAALDAFKFFLGRNFKHALALAAQALHSERPAQLLQQSAALFVRGEHLSEVGKSHA